MSEKTEPLAATLTRCWVRIYTAGLSDEVRRARRAELESDLWEQMHGTHYAPSGRYSVALHIVYRTIAGAPHDFLWRLGEQRRSHAMKRSTARNTMTEVAATIAAFYAIVGLMILLQIGGLEAGGMSVAEAAAWTWSTAAVVVIGMWITKHSFWLGLIVVSVGTAPLLFHGRVLLFTPQFFFLMLGTFLTVHFIRRRHSRHVTPGLS